ncbi:hypothetical protein B0T16DRAFT_111387 [Cercophora newfieldiana]|uniref:Uncharacterized protein n=1 Tax=Cercophora newfieldiana TaxID=92897 RepID=A0AA40CVN7_9PEZI|nr:hypothetical protein B0T16DRAFT_111387 [Cercophora newfieldiana]
MAGPKGTFPTRPFSLRARPSCASAKRTWIFCRKQEGSLMPAPRARRSVIAETASPQTPEPHARAHYPSQQFPHSDTHIRKNQLEALEEELAKRSEQLQAALKSIEQQKDYIFALSNRLSSAERECKSFEHSVKKATDLQNDITAQSNLRYELKVLRDQHIKMEGQRRVVALSQDDEVRPSSQSVREEFELLVADLKDACSSVNITIPAAVNPSDSDMTEGNTALESWSRRLTGLHFGRLISHALQTDISDIHLMTALTATGVAELVFESSFPDFLTKSSPMLDQYREHILTKVHKPSEISTC